MAGVWNQGTEEEYRTLLSNAKGSKQHALSNASSSVALVVPVTGVAVISSFVLALVRVETSYSIPLAVVFVPIWVACVCAFALVGNTFRALAVALFGPTPSPSSLRTSLSDDSNIAMIQYHLWHLVTISSTALASLLLAVFFYLHLSGTNSNIYLFFLWIITFIGVLHASLCHGPVLNALTWATIAIFSILLSLKAYAIISISWETVTSPLLLLCVVLAASALSTLVLHFLEMYSLTLRQLVCALLYPPAFALLAFAIVCLDWLLTTPDDSSLIHLSKISLVCAIAGFSLFFGASYLAIRGQIAKVASRSGADRPKSIIRKLGDVEGWDVDPHTGHIFSFLFGEVEMGIHSEDVSWCCSCSCNDFTPDAQKSHLRAT